MTVKYQYPGGHERREQSASENSEGSIFPAISNVTRGNFIE